MTSYYYESNNNDNDNQQQQWEEPYTPHSRSIPIGGGPGTSSSSSKDPQQQHQNDTDGGETSELTSYDNNSAELLLLGSTPSTLGSESLAHFGAGAGSNANSSSAALSQDDDNTTTTTTAAAAAAAALPVQHSDFTVPTSNARRRSKRDGDASPPPDLLLHHPNCGTAAAAVGGGGQPHGQQQPRDNNNNNRRAIFGKSIQRKYGTLPNDPNNSNGNRHHDDYGQLWQRYSSHSIPFYKTVEGGVLAPQSPVVLDQQQQRLMGGGGEQAESSLLLTTPPGSIRSTTAAAVAANGGNNDHSQHHQQQQHPTLLAYLLGPSSTIRASSNTVVSPLTSPTTSTRGIRSKTESKNDRSNFSDDHGEPLRNGNDGDDANVIIPLLPGRRSSSASRSPAKQFRNHTGSTIRHRHRKALHRTTTSFHETRHAQSLLLGMAFAAVWSPNNILAPNLTEAAEYFGFVTEQERDLYLGSYVALAVAVFSLPLSAAIGVYTDLVYSRKYLFVGTVLTGALAATATAYCKTYGQLLFCRWLNGGCMAGSVPVAFSFLGDLFDITERNAASSGLTAMMGLGIIVGQVYAGSSWTTHWDAPFRWSGAITAVLAILCAVLVQDPVRGGKEQVLQDMIRAGTRYERKLTWAGFYQTVVHNASNFILLWQGFFSSLPWGVIFVFLNDFLSQERGFSVPGATYLVAVFGVGCAVGGILGGYLGQLVMHRDRSYLPLFMAVTTVLGTVPFLILLNSHFPVAHGWKGSLCAGMAGLIASLPSVNVRPCLINVNPPESRGAALTAANLLINLGRGFGPSCITIIQSIGRVDRKFAFNVTMSTFWVISSLQLLLLMKTLPEDQDTMENELASYAAKAILDAQGADQNNVSMDMSVVGSRDGNESLISIEERITSFDSVAAQQTLGFMKAGFKELRSPLFPCAPVNEGGPSSESSSESLHNQGAENDSDDEAVRRRRIWLQQDSVNQPDGGVDGKDDLNDGQWTDETLLVPEFPRQHPDETTGLLV